GNIKFTSNADLASETVTEYILWLDETKNGPNEDGMTLGELGTQAKKYFGIDGFDPGRQSTFYNTATDSYFMLGRGLAPFNMFVKQISDGNGIAVVEVTDFDLLSDPLMLKPISVTEYTLSNNWNGSYTFESGKLKR
ncbi:MAG: hypothetical protein RR049_05650, partial [Angelakisella sp.]